MRRYVYNISAYNILHSSKVIIMKPKAKYMFSSTALLFFYNESRNSCIRYHVWRFCKNLTVKFSEWSRNSGWGFPM